MLKVDGSKYVTVFNPQIKNDISDKIVFANLSTSKKNVGDGTQQPTYVNMSWRGRFVGKAFEKAKELKDKDKIDIVNGIITNRYDKEKEKLYVEVTIFDFEYSVKENQ